MLVKIFIRQIHVELYYWAPRSGFLLQFQVIGCGSYPMNLMGHQIKTLSGLNVKVFLSLKEMLQWMVCLIHCSATDIFVSSIFLYDDCVGGKIVFLLLVPQTLSISG